ncbi:MAG: Smr/MutS family protein [Clostridia bacterium]
MVDIDVLKYGKNLQLDLHGLSRDEAICELIYSVENVDSDIKAILIVHGFHKGTVLSKLVRREFSHKFIYKIIKVDASRTLYLIDKGNYCG